jgi:hypothetical protein
MGGPSGWGFIIPFVIAITAWLIVVYLLIRDDKWPK